MGDLLKPLVQVFVGIAMIVFMSGCATLPEQECPKPHEFTEKAHGPLFTDFGWLTFEARQIVDGGLIKSIVIDKYWYWHKCARYTIDLPSGSRDVAFRLERMGFWLTYVTAQNERILEEWWWEEDGMGGGFLVPVLSAPTYTVGRAWQQEPDGSWMPTFTFDPGFFGAGRKVKREVKPKDP